MITSRIPNQRALNVDAAVRERYRDAAEELEPQLCCAVEYDPQYLEVLPKEIIERDYGCGDPAQYVGPGETVLDLGCGAGKVCFIASQIVGSSGRVIGVDCNDTMLGLARQHQSEIGERIGHHNVEFRKGRIQDLRLDLDRLEEYLAVHPTRTSRDWLHAEEHAEHLRQTEPMIAENSIDLVVSNCVLNLVRAEDRQRLFAELYRVLKPGGRVVISDIVSDEEIPDHLRQDAHLWSGCMSGAFREAAFLNAFVETGFYGVEMLSRQAEPWAIVEGIEFRSVTVRAFKGKEGPCLERNQAVIYNGPWKKVTDDDGHTLNRGERMAVCDKTYRILTREPYASQITAVPPSQDVPLEEAEMFDCKGSTIRSPEETKRGTDRKTVGPPQGECGESGCC